MKKHPKHIVIDARIRRSSTGRYVDRLVEHLQDIDKFHKYTVLLQPDDHLLMKNKNFSAVPCSCPQFSLNPVDQLKFALQLYRLRADLVHFTMTQQPLLYVGNIVTTTHDTTMYHFVRRGNTNITIYKLKMALYRLLVWWSHHKSKYIIVPTKTVAEEFAQLQPFTKKKIVVTYEAAEPPMKAKAEKPKGIKSPFILYVGTAFPHKNLNTLTKAFDILYGQRPDLRLVLVGKREKHYDELFNGVRKLKSFNNITITGWLKDEELKWLYENCEAYVFTSLSEGFGLPPLEAMSYGAPVVSSNISVMPEVYGDAAHYFNPKKPREIAEKISEVLTDQDLRRALIDSGYKCIKKYSWHKMAEETLIVYKESLRETEHNEDSPFA